MTGSAPARSRRSRWGWGILIGVGALIAVNGVALFFASSREDSFEQDTGVPMTAVEAVFPTVVDAVVELGQLSSMLLAALGGRALVLSIGGLRLGSRLAWSAMWVLVLALVAVGLRVPVAGSTAIGVGYLVLAAVVAGGLALAQAGLGQET